MATIRITELFGAQLAQDLSDKICTVYANFDSKGFVAVVGRRTEGLSYTQRIEVIAEELHNFLPPEYPKALSVLMQILGPENPSETGMFTHYYWLMPVGKFVQLYGLDNFELSMNAIEEITKRNTGEYAVRPYIRRYPQKSLRRIKLWAKSDNFHLRRLASEGLRPKLPWAPKLDEFIDNPAQVFEILEILKSDPVKFVQKSVANHLTDYLKVNPQPTRELIARWQKSGDVATLWIVKRATRKIT